MSTTDRNPAEITLAPQEPSCPGGVKVEIITAREVPLGGPRAMTVYRTLPQKQRSTIGAWCFVDHYGPDDVSETGGMDVPSHPHTGLQTVSWLFRGNIDHHDSGDNHGVVRPGEVNLMTAGGGICHTEVSTQDTTILHGVQLWLALPDEARHTERAFEHYAPPLLQLDGAEALVFLGSLFGSTSPVKTYTGLLGAELRVEPGRTVEIAVNPEFEHGFLVDSGTVKLDGVEVKPTELGYTGVGEKKLTVANEGEDVALIVIIGGEPFTENLVMWWNFLGRSSEEIVKYRQEWEEHSERFGKTDGYIGYDPDGLTRLPAPTMPQIQLRPRSNPAPVARPEERN